MIHNLSIYLIYAGARHADQLKKPIVVNGSFFSCLHISCSDANSNVNIVQQIPTLHALAFEKLKDPLLNCMDDPGYMDFLETVELYDHKNLFKRFINNYKKDPDSDGNSYDNICPLSENDTNIFLLRAMKEDQSHVIKFLIARGLYINSKDSAVSMFAKRAKGDDLEELVEPWITDASDKVDRNNIHLRREMVFAPLFIVVSYDSEKVTQALIAAGADVNAKDVIGRTPLHYVAESSGSEKILEILIAAGADVNAKNYYGISVLDTVPNDDKSMYQIFRAVGAQHADEIEHTIYYFIKSNISNIISFLLMRFQNVRSDIWQVIARNIKY